MRLCFFTVRNSKLYSDKLCLAKEGLHITFLLILEGDFKLVLSQIVQFSDLLMFSTVSLLFIRKC